MAAPIVPLKEPSSDRILSNRELILILQNSKLHGCVFPPWKVPPVADEFSLEHDTLFTDPSNFQLSDVQKEVFDGWCRPDEVLPPRNVKSAIHQRANIGPTMISHERIDLVQDLTSDCSVVASLCSMTAREEKGHAKLLPSIMYPLENTNMMPMRSLNGKYVFRLNFNGCYRRVVIDDRLPASVSARTLHVIDRSNPGLLWPALVEKAYLKIRGGYDFPGSNSGTDLWVLIGWIPEQMFLQSDEAAPDALWRRVLNAYNYGDVLITMGTGKMTVREEQDTGLAGEHDYAVIDMKETENGGRFFLFKNPWSEGNVWMHHPEPSFMSTQGHSAIDIIDLSKELMPGTFWMNMNHVFQNFHSIYLNWNPGLFSYRQDVHFQWDLNNGRSTLGSFERNPQFVVHSKDGGTAWLLLSRHFQDTTVKTIQGCRAGFISLYAFNQDGYRILLSDGATARSPYVDASNTLLKLQLPANSSYTIVVSEQDLFSSNYTFSLSAFSLKPLEIQEAVIKHSYSSTYQGSWTVSSCGGSANSLAYYTNPQLSLSLAVQSDLLLLLTAEEEFSVHVKLVWAGGKRVNHLTNRDIVCDSGDYRRGSAVAETSGLQVGAYTAICSTFEQGQRGKFSLHVYSSANCLLRSILIDEAGRLLTKVPRATFFLGTERLLAPLHVSRITRLRATVRGQATQGSKCNSPMRIALEHGQGPYKDILAISGDGKFVENPVGMQIKDVDIASNMCRGKGIWLVLERLGGSCLLTSEAVDIEILSDNPVEVGRWGKEVEGSLDNV